MFKCTTATACGVLGAALWVSGENGVKRDLPDEMNGSNEMPQPAPLNEGAEEIIKEEKVEG